MAYGELKVDSITFTNGGADTTVSVSGLVQNPTFSGDLTVTGTISGNVVKGGTLVSGATVSGTAGEFGTVTGNTAGFTTVTGTTVTGTTGQFTSITGGTAGFTTITGTTVTGTTANFVTVSGTTVTGNSAQFTTLTGGTAGFTTVTGTTVTGTTINAASGVFSTQVSGATVTGNAGQFTTLTGGTAGFTTVTGTTVTGNSGNFTTLTTTTANVTSGVFASGTAAAPSVSVGTTDNGIYSPGTDQVALSTNGTQRINIEADGDINIDSGGVFYDATNNRLGIGTTNPGVALHVDGDIRADGIYGEADTNTSIQFPGSDVITFNEGGSEAARIDSSGRLLVGTSTVSSNGSSRAQIYGGDLIVSATNTGATGRLISVGTNTAAARTTGMLGELRFASLETSNWGPCIRGYGVAGQNYDQNQLTFHTNNAGSGPPTEQLRITSDRYVRLASGTGGIQFNGDTAAANALDDYEEGTWTPALTFGGGSTGITYVNATGEYTKVGNLVFIHASIGLSNKGASTGNVRITGLPFASYNSRYVNVIPRAVTNMTFTAPLYASAQANELTTLSLLDNNSGTQRFLTDTAFANDTFFVVTGFYYTTV